MRFLLLFGIAGLILYFIIIGGILVWPLINVVAYLKVLIFPRAVRKKYGSDINALSKSSFDKEITQEDKENIKKLNDSIKGKKDQIRGLKSLIHKKKITLKRLGNLKRNKDGSISQRSKAGKEGSRIVDTIRSYEAEISIKDDSIASEENSIDNIFLKPYFAWKNWSTRFGRYLGNRDSIIFMIVGFPIFFFALANFNLLELSNPTFRIITEMYIYIIFVAPISDWFGIMAFNEGVFSSLISYDYAVLLSENYKEFFTFYNWLIVALPMPLMTLIVYSISKKIHITKTKSLEPEPV